MSDVNETMTEATHVASNVEQCVLSNDIMPCRLKITMSLTISIGE